MGINANEMANTGNKTNRWLSDIVTVMDPSGRYAIPLPATQRQKGLCFNTQVIQSFLLTLSSGLVDIEKGGTLLQPQITKQNQNYKYSSIIEGLHKPRSGSLGESNHMKAILVRESREMEDELVILGGKWMKDTNDLTSAKWGSKPLWVAIEGEDASDFKLPTNSANIFLI
ncbi:hypothetical protein Tco_0838989 [Tanacetum coccineum]|uniref:Uncharacterized protein n=1 Tax=Tanacetum coccineum TaxID=301880 RepID=A0ABQ5ASK2_9ASTR